MISRETRQHLIRSYAERNGGVYDPKGFLAEVREQGRNHPAYAWFEWDDQEAAEEHRVEQARRFATGLKVVFSVEQVGGGVVRVTAPMMHSPLGSRGEGGGYRVTDMTQPAHVDELRAQAARDLEAWRRRYEAVLVADGVMPDVDALAGRFARSVAA